jgi:hypothetical protein
MSDRPNPKAIIDTPEVFKELADAYYERCTDEKIPMTMTGLALALGFSSRQSIHDYGKMAGFADVVSHARLTVEHGYELQMAKGRGDAGVIFALKNMGWSDKQEIQHTEKVVDSGENGW